MKKTLLLATLALSINAFAQIPTCGLIAHYPFDGNTNDISGNNYNGTNNGATLTIDRFGNTDSAYNFNGSSFISIPSVAETGNAARSFFAWVKFTIAPPNGMAIISTGTSNNGNSFNLVVNYGSSTLGVMGYNNDFYPTGVIISDNQWHFVGAIYDGAGNIATYVDGMLDNSGTLTFNTTGQNNFIGKSNDVSPAFFNGDIDDILIYNRALTQTEINSIYKGGLCFQTVTVTDTLIINANITGFNPITYQHTIKIYPNPTNDLITIDYGNYNSLAGYTLKIVNTLSQTVFTTAINQQTSYINLSSWTGMGVYFVHLIDPLNNTVDIRKIVLQ